MNAPRLKAMAGLPWVPCAGIETAGPVEQVRSERCPPRIARRPCFVGPRRRSDGAHGYLALFGWDARKGFAVTRE